MLEFNTVSNVTATRKDHTCVGCGQIITRGSEAVYFAQKWEGEFHHGHYHADCSKAEARLNELYETYPEEWMALSDREPEDNEWLSEEFPAVHARLMGGDNA